MASHQRFDILSLVVQNLLHSNSKIYQIHGDKQFITQILPTAPERAYITNDCYDSSLDLGSIPYTDILQRLLRVGFQIHSTTSGSYASPKSAAENAAPDTFVLQYTLIRTQLID